MFKKIFKHFHIWKFQKRTSYDTYKCVVHGNIFQGLPFGEKPKLYGINIVLKKMRD